ncbi:hypothetical protein HPP92_024909 [Vanilla planifolia]|uniref:Uncharacterized protein n=1 Tax=Vanilla planifolia TaxID=51239 RepID=A0A835PGW4_VANPL|nr:hypothetical protein HPP92_025192 [Vanilla planifolia]KAG0453605.1 hypothetical protein HPP92_024909 [Vanilla planifolia]
MLTLTDRQPLYECKCRQKKIVETAVDNRGQSLENRGQLGRAKCGCVAQPRTIAGDDDLRGISAVGCEPPGKTRT